MWSIFWSYWESLLMRISFNSHENFEKCILLIFCYTADSLCAMLSVIVPFFLGVLSKQPRLSAVRVCIIMCNTNSFSELIATLMALAIIINTEILTCVHFFNGFWVSCLVKDFLLSWGDLNIAPTLYFFIGWYFVFIFLAHLKFKF